MSDINDQELKQYLEGNSELSRRYRAETHTEVPERVDDTILGIARMSADAQKTAERSLFQRWQTPLSIAAVLMLSVSLVITMYDEYGEDYLQTPNQPALEQINSSAPVAAEELLPADNSAEMSDQASDDTSSGTIHKKAARAEPIQIEQEEEQEEEQEFEQQEFEMEMAQPKPVPESSAPQADEFKEEAGTGAILGINKQIEVLESEVQELRQTQKKLLRERATLESDLQQVEQQRNSIKQKIDHDQEVDKPSLQAELDEIKRLWLHVDQQEAISRLQQFRELYPVISDDDLLTTLPQTLVEAAR